MNPLVGYPSCRAALERIFAEARTSLEHDPNAAKVNAIADELVDFTNVTSATDPADEAQEAAIEELRQIASDSARELTFAALASCIDLIDAGARELEALAGGIKSRTFANLKEADRLRLAPVVNAIDAMTNIVEKVKLLGQSLDGGVQTEAEVIARINAFIANYEALRESVAKLGSAAGG